MQIAMAAEALNTKLLQVLKLLTQGLAVTMLMAAGIAAVPGLAQAIFTGILGYIVIFIPVILSLFLMFRMNQLSTAQIKYSFWAFAVSFGVSLSLIFSVFTAASIVQSLLITTVSFGALAGWGYFTKKDLTSMGGFLFAGVIALILIGLFNIWFGSSLLQTILNILAVGIFLGLTAYDMQQIRNQLWANDSDLQDRVIVIGALSLFINYINIFVNLVQLLGNRE